MQPYTPEQRTRHLLAKLKPALRTSIITHHDVPQKREDLISLATWLESAGKKGDGSGSHSSHKRNASEAQPKRYKKKRSSSPSRSGTGSDRIREGRKDVVCYNYDKPSHISINCSEPRKDKASTRKVGAGAKKAKTKTKVKLEAAKEGNND